MRDLSRGEHLGEQRLHVRPVDLRGDRHEARGEPPGRAESEQQRREERLHGRVLVQRLEVPLEQTHVLVLQAEQNLSSLTGLDSVINQLSSISGSNLKILLIKYYKYNVY